MAPKAKAKSGTASGGVKRNGPLTGIASGKAGPPKGNVKGGGGKKKEDEEEMLVENEFDMGGDSSDDSDEEGGPSPEDLAVGEEDSDSDEDGDGEDEDEEEEEGTGGGAQNLLDSDDDENEEDEDEDEEDDDEDEDDEEDEDDLENESDETGWRRMEEASKKLEGKKGKDLKGASDELQLNLSVGKRKREGEAEEGEEEEDEEEDLLDAAEKQAELLMKTGKEADLKFIRQRIADSVLLLENWKQAPQKMKESRPRSSVIDQIAADVATLYGYSVELADYFLKFFAPAEAIEFFEANEEDRPTTIRTNTLKTKRRDLAQALIARGANVDPVGEWTKVGLVVKESSVPIGATPEYMAGHYMLQSAASFVPAMALNPLPGEKVLDMAAAPGGKSSHLAQLMKNTGTLFSNDAKRDRCTPLMSNFHRLGVTNVVVLNLDGRRLPHMLPKLDRVLLDAPCTGVGIIARDPQVKSKRTVEDFVQQSSLQKELLAAAIDCVDANSKTGGFIVYSTCSLAVEENEAVVDHALKVRHVKLVPLGIGGGEGGKDFGSEGVSSYRDMRFHPSMKLTRRYYPHRHNMDGFFVAKLQKVSNEIPERVKKDRRKTNEQVQHWDESKWTSEFMDQAMDFEEGATDGDLKETSKKKAKKAKAAAAAAAASGGSGAASSQDSKGEAGSSKEVPKAKQKENTAKPQPWGKKLKKSKKLALKKERLGISSEDAPAPQAAAEKEKEKGDAGGAKGKVKVEKKKKKGGGSAGDEKGVSGPPKKKAKTGGPPPSPSSSSKKNQKPKMALEAENGTSRSSPRLSPAGKPVSLSGPSGASKGKEEKQTAETKGRGKTVLKPKAKKGVKESGSKRLITKKKAPVGASSGEPKQKPKK